MIKLFRKLALHQVQMFIDHPYHLDNTNIIHATFKRGSKILTRPIDLSEFTDVWGGDHVLENVLEAYLDEFLAEIGKPNLDRTVKISGGE